MAGRNYTSFLLG